MLTLAGLLACKHSSAHDLDNPQLNYGFRNSDTAFLQTYMDALNADITPFSLFKEDGLDQVEFEFHTVTAKFEERCLVWLTATHFRDLKTRGNKTIVDVKAFTVDLEARHQDQEVKNRKTIDTEPWGGRILVPKTVQDERENYRDFRYPGSPLYERTVKDMRRLVNFMQGIDYCMGVEGDAQADAATTGQLVPRMPSFAINCTPEQHPGCQGAVKEPDLHLGWFPGRCEGIELNDSRSLVSRTKAVADCDADAGCQWDAVQEEELAWTKTTFEPGSYFVFGYLDINGSGKRDLAEPQSCVDVDFPASGQVTLDTWR